MNHRRPFRTLISTQPRRADWLRRLGRLKATFPAGLLAAMMLVGSMATFALRAEEPRADDKAAKTKTADDEIKKPKGWPKRLPLPQEKTNCVRCHLNAGRELTLAVRDFTHSVHDLNLLSCNDCHGGNTEDDALAHDEQVGFIGTKLSAHLKNCAGCHEEQDELLQSGPHAWNFSKKINLDYPMCVDCHGNHDVGNPPADFHLKDVCLDCHEDLDKKHSTLAGVIDENDKYWATLIRVREKDLDQEDPIPEPFQDRVDELRHETMTLVHTLGKIPKKKADALNHRAETLRRDLEAWLDKG